MKKHINPFKCLALLAFALSPFLSFANTGDNVEKKRTISKSYAVGPDDRLSIENSFGNIVITTWDKSEIQVDVEISVRASTDERAQHMMDQINVTDHQGGKEIGFKTEIGNMGKTKDNGGEDNRKFYVDYKVSMPSRNPIRIENSFGKISIPDFTGTASLTSKFGELTTGQIPNAKTIHVEFGKAEIGRLNNADVVFKFNSRSSVAGISGSSKVDVQFCSQVSLMIDKSINELSLFQSYSTIDLKVPDDLSAQFDVYTNFGSFKNRTGFNISEENEESSGPKFDKNYSGKAGGGSAKIKIKSSFGSVRLINDKDKSVDKDNGKEDKDDKDDDDKDDGKVNL
jgi:hypothetical protein